jgi:hypothetical protein
MMGSLIHEFSTNGSNLERSGLTNIRGIGAIRKRSLNALEIYTIADLAQASADAIEAQFKQDGRSLSRDELEEWITQAQRVSLSSESAKPPKKEKELAANQFSRSSEAQPSEAQSPEAQPPEAQALAKPEDLSAPWNSIALFKVEYQARQMAGKPEQQVIIRHLETDAVERWTDFETNLIQQWMLDRVEANLLPSKIEDPIVPEIAQLQVTQRYQLGQPMTADKICPLFPNAIQSDEPFVVEVFMKFAGLTDISQRKQMAYQIQCIARNVSTGATVNLGDVTANVTPSDDSVYKVVLPTTILPHTGIYRLKILVTLQNSPAILAYFKVPMFQVV